MPRVEGFRTNVSSPTQTRQPTWPGILGVSPPNISRTLSLFGMAGHKTTRAPCSAIATMISFVSLAITKSISNCRFTQPACVSNDYRLLDQHEGFASEGAFTGALQCQRAAIIQWYERDQQAFRLGNRGNLLACTNSDSMVQICGIRSSYLSDAVEHCFGIVWSCFGAVWR